MGAGPRALLNFFALSPEAQKVSEIVAGISGAPVSGVWISRGERAPLMRASVTGLGESRGLAKANPLTPGTPPSPHARGRGEPIPLRSIHTRRGLASVRGRRKRPPPDGIRK